MALTLTPEGVVLAAAMMRKAGNRGRLLLLIAGAPYDVEHFHELSVRTAAHFLGLSARYVHELFVALVSSGMVERRPGAGSRSDAWRVRGDVTRWAVLWPPRRDPDHVRLILAQAGHLLDVRPAAPEPIARGSIAQREADFARGFIAQQSPELSRGSIAQQKARRLRAGLEPNTTVLPHAPESVPVPETTTAEGGGRARALEPMAAEWVRQVSGVVYRRTGRPVIGRGADRLGRLHGRLSVEQADQCLAMLPDGAGFGVVMGALEVAASGVPARANGSSAPVAPEPPPEVPPDERARVLEGLRAARVGKGHG
jgi:hypothetical protein